MLGINSYGSSNIKFEIYFCIDRTHLSGKSCIFSLSNGLLLTPKRSIQP